MSYHRNRTPRIRYPSMKVMLLRAQQFVETTFVETGNTSNLMRRSHSLIIAERAAHISPEAQVVALLHDILEETGAGISLINDAFNPVITAAVDAISRRPGEPYLSYIQRVRTNDMARRVKIIDICDTLLTNSYKGAPVEAVTMRPRMINALQELLVEPA